jgi:hypothetical protein
MRGRRPEERGRQQHLVDLVDDEVVAGVERVVDGGVDDARGDVDLLALDGDVERVLLD